MNTTIAAEAFGPLGQAEALAKLKVDETARAEVEAFAAVLSGRATDASVRGYAWAGFHDGFGEVEAEADDEDGYVALPGIVDRALDTVHDLIVGVVNGVLWVIAIAVVVAVVGLAVWALGDKAIEILSGKPGTLTFIRDNPTEAGAAISQFLATVGAAIRNLFG